MLTPDGRRPIEQLRVGDKVLSRSEHDLYGPLEGKEVEVVFVREAPIINLWVRDLLISTTAEHPFWVRGRGWQMAAELSPGDLLASHDGTWIELTRKSEAGEIATVYNVRIADYHTYFVGDAYDGFSVWAHNYPSGTGGLTPAQQSAVRKISNIRRGHLKPGPLGDISGAVADIVGAPIPKPSGGFWDHAGEMQNTLRGLRKAAEKLEGTSDPVGQAALQDALSAITEILDAISGAGL